MALVAYDASDSESITDEEEDGAVEIVEKTPTMSETALFNNLPQPKGSDTFTDIAEENDEFLLKKERPTEQPTVKKPIKIIAPAINDFDSDEDEPKEKRVKFNSKSSGLFSILPPPKSTVMSTKSMVPNSVQKKTKTSGNPLIPRTVARQKKNVETNTKRQVTSDDEDDLNVEEFDVNAWKQVCARKRKPDPIIQVIDHSENISMEIDTAPEPVEPYNGLDNEAFKKLVGSSKMRPENIKLIDINEDEVITPENIDRAKAITDPEVQRSATVDEPISAISKRKHHITYLAQQAKANEQELKNRWASNKFSRKQTQAKYGF